ncbi:33320_t:CDS:2, partial [Gigaspora margarita]
MRAQDPGPLILYPLIDPVFSYEIIKEGVYLKAPLSAYTSTSKGKQYKIPDRYGVKTTIGRYKKKKVIYCSINYENNCPIFCISYGENFEYKISSTSSSSAANKWEKAINPNSKTAWSGILVFGLQLESVNKAREAKNRELKSIENCSNHTILKRAKKFGSQALELLKSKSLDNYSKKDRVNIKAIDYSVNNYNFHIDFGKEDLVKTKQNQLATVQALDKAKISREGYRNIAAVNPTISREYAVFNERILLTKQMEANIKITQVNLEFLEVEIDSTEVENVDPKEITNMARIGAQ